jgi:hypothetical protein
MKKLILAFILLGGAFQLKAQQAKVNPADSILASINNSIKVQNNLWKQLTSGPKAGQVLALNNDKTVLQGSVSAVYMRDNMPVAVLPGNSKMPIARLGGYDKMPVMGINPNNREGADQQLLRSLPASKLPALLSPAPGK